MANRYNQGHDSQENKLHDDDLLSAETHERTALLQAVIVILLALMIVSYLEGIPA